ncbi:MAG: hypothetical protein J6L03_05480 [Bacteroidaceae bacterium]|nr:hypothetical protein [Bacteroidaceae bacterium]
MKKLNIRVAVLSQQSYEVKYERFVLCCRAWITRCVLWAHSLACVYLVLTVGTAHEAVCDG